MMRAIHASIWTILVLAAALAGCAAGPLSDQMPQSLGGLPADAPARPTTPYQYPAVHDMPPPRASAPMNDEEQFKLEKELRAIRDRQESQEGNGGQKAPKAKKVLEAPVSRGAKAGQARQSGTAVIAVPPARQKSAQPPEKQPKNLPNNAILVPPAGVKTNP
jgi:hypothetical protein